ncbi:hypothetical protein AAVH_17177 [Aphelenchoides avenae]|nr:hypothetical protein AAVH_17177 [Aphelenchus avenae]
MFSFFLVRPDRGQLDRALSMLIRSNFTVSVLFCGVTEALALEQPWVRFMDLAAIYQTILFVILIYLVTCKSENMPRYRWCLLANVISIYLFVVAMWLYKPFVFAKGYYLVPLGLVSKLGSKGHFYYLFGAFFIATCHGVAIGVCVVYQASKMTTELMVGIPELITSFIFRSGMRFTACFIGVSLAIWVLVVECFLHAKVDFDPLLKWSSSAIANDNLLYTYLSSRQGVFLLRLDVDGWLLPSALLLAVAAGLIVWVIIWLTRKNREELSKQNERTASLQLALNRYVLAQVCAVVALYLVPLEVGAIAAVTNRRRASEAHVATALAHFVLAIYPPLNYTMILVYVRHYRRELRATLSRFRSLTSNCLSRERSNSVVYLSERTTPGSRVPENRRYRLSLPF